MEHNDMSQERRECQVNIEQRAKKKKVSEFLFFGITFFFCFTVSQKNLKRYKTESLHFMAEGINEGDKKDIVDKHYIIKFHFLDNFVQFCR